MMKQELEKCKICPHQCSVTRKGKNIGFCRANDKIQIAHFGMHYDEEPCISGCGNCEKIEIKRKGSGTIFFSHCNLKCVFCQNYKISQGDYGMAVSIDTLSKIMMTLQKQGAYNINLVTPTIYALQIKEAIMMAKQKGLNIPIIYNSSGYENVETLKQLEGYIDVYLPDFKYFDDDLALQYSKVKNYFKYASLAIKEMYRQVGLPIFDENGMIQRGIMIRHMILPNHTRDSKKILAWIKENMGSSMYISVMAQYFPTHQANLYEKINRKISKKELKIVENYMYDLDFSHGYIQKIGKNEEKYVPNFNINCIKEIEK